MDIVSYLLGKNSSSGGGSGLDWTVLGFETTPQSITNGYNYAVQIQQGWVVSGSWYNKFLNDYKLTYMPLVDTGTATDFQYAFNNCYGLQNIALLDMKNAAKLQNIFTNCYSLKEIPLFNFQNVTHTQNAFQNCVSLTTIPAISMPSLKYAQNMFLNCPSLTTDSLKNILDICINATNYAQTKTLAYLGFSASTNPAATIQSLPNYQQFLNAGWTIGY